jgi:3-oxoacyl-[acyl-carrier protein] reductase
MMTNAVKSELLRGRTALVTGASGGIGRAMTARLLAGGATVIGTSRHTAAADQALLANGCHLIQADMCDLDAVSGLVAQVEAEYGPIDLLLPNAGHAEPRGWSDVTLAEWDKSITVNLTAPFILAQAAAVGMAERGFGRILFTSSAAAYVGGFVGPHYAAAKAGLHGLVHYLSSRLAASGVTVNAIAPALIENTKMISGYPGGDPPHPPVGRLGTPEDVAELTVAVLTNGYLTGQVILLDGGLHPN